MHSATPRLAECSAEELLLSVMLRNTVWETTDVLAEEPSVEKLLTNCGTEEQSMGKLASVRRLRMPRKPSHHPILVCVFNSSIN